MRDLLNLTVHALAQTGDPTYAPPLVGVVILAAGVLQFKNLNNETVTATFPAVEDGGSYPFILWTGIRQILDSATTLTDDQVLLIRN